MKLKEMLFMIFVVSGILFLKKDKFSLSTDSFYLNKHMGICYHNNQKETI